MIRRKRFIIIGLCLIFIRYMTLEIKHLTNDCRPDPSTANYNCRQSLTKRYNVSCEKLIKGDTDYMKTLSSISLRRPRCETKSFQSCDNIVSRRGHHFDQYISNGELHFPLAFSLKVHRDPLQVEQLLRTIYRPHNVYCIHVDVKSSKSVYRIFQMIASCFKNVFVIQKINVVYGSIGLLMSDIVCMKELWKSKVKWKYYINLSGQEFPLKTNLEITEILKMLKGKNEIETYPFPKSLYFRFTRKHFIENNKIFQSQNISKPPFKHKIPFYKGSMYGMFTRNFVHFVLNSPISKDLISWCADTYAPEELVWATLNSLPGVPGGYNVTVRHGQNHFLSRAMIWRWDKMKCHGKYVRGVCVFNSRDLPWLISSPEVVANKFHSDYDQLVVDCLEEWLYNKTVTGTTVNMNWYHYRNVPHMKINYENY